MVNTFPAQSVAHNLAQTLERQIDERTFRRVRQLHIDSAAGRVVVHGVTSSYYVKQLALAAVGEVTDPDLVDVDIQVA
jgi:hypothetical protein